MNTTKLLTLGLIILGLFGLSAMATATVTTADGNDNVYFLDEAITLSWTGSGLYSYVWVTKDENLSNASAYCIGTPSAGMKLGVSSYVLNTSVNCTETGVYLVYVNKSNSATSPAISSSFDNNNILLNNYTVVVTPDYNTFGVFGGDNATVIIATTGDDFFIAQRVAATFNVTTTEANVTPVQVSASATTGNITFKVPVSGTAGTYNVTVSNGAAQGTGKYAVRTFNIKAYDRTVSTNTTSVVLEALDENAVLANYSAAGDLTFALVISGLTDNMWDNGSQTYNVVFPSGVNTSSVSTKIATGTSTGTAIITATCLNFTLSDTANYTVRASGENITISSTRLNGTVATSFSVDQNVTILGWINDDAATVNLNITNGSAVVYNVTGISPATGGAWTTTWDTALTSLVNTGAYTILAWKNGSVNNSENATAAITLTDAIAVTSATSTNNGTNLTDAVYADQNMTINGTSSKLTGTVTVNVTNAAGYTSTSTPAVVNGTFGTTWVANVTAAGTYTVTVKDGMLVSASKTITVLNNLTATIPASGPVASSITLRGTSTRADSTNVSINISDSVPIKVLTNAQATITTRNWTYTWNTYLYGNTSQLALAAGTYTITVTDGITTTTGTIVLGTGSISNVAAAPVSIFLDDTVNITGTTSFPAGTAVDVNITNCAGVSINTTTATVAADQSFLATFTPNVALANIKVNTAIAAGVPATLCVAVNVGTITGSTTFAIKDDLALTTVASAVAGDKVLLSGTSSRANTTGITIKVSLSNYVVSKSTTVSGGAFSEGTYYATSDGTNTGDALSAGTYTINATDGVVSVIKTISIVSTGVIQITAPSNLQNITIGDNYMIMGTSNRVNGTGINISISGLNVTPTINIAVNTLGIFNGTWNTTGYSAGYYTIKAEVFGETSEFAIVTAVLTSGPTTTTTTSSTTTLGNGTTTTSSTTTTTLANQTCVMPGNSAPCGVVTLSEVVAAINSWSAGTLALGDVIDLINSWADVTAYPAD